MGDFSVLVVVVYMSKKQTNKKPPGFSITQVAERIAIPEEYNVMKISLNWLQFPVLMILFGGGRGNANYFIAHELKTEFKKMA